MDKSRRHKIEPKGNFRAERYNNQNKASIDGLNSTMKRKEEGISELEDITIQITSCAQRESKLEKKNQHSLRVVWDHNKMSLTLVSLKSWKERRKRMGTKKHSKK